MSVVSKLRAAAAVIVLGAAPALAQDKILNVSYDIGRELFEALNPAFVAQWKETTGRDVTVDQSHGGSSAQARAILEGLNADVVAFNQETDIDVLVNGGLVDADWRNAFPNGASPYYSLPAFVVRAGNPKDIKDWSDLVRDDVQPIFANPRTSGNARYTYLAAYAFALEASGGDDAAATEFVRKLLSNVPVFDTGARASSQTFAERNIGDVLISFEAETAGITAQFEGLERVTPATSLFAAFPVAVVKENAEKNGSVEVSTAYLNWLYTPEAQRILADQNFRVVDETVKTEVADRFPEVKLLTVDVLGGWAEIKAKHFDEGGILDQVFAN